MTADDADEQRAAGAERASGDHAARAAGVLERRPASNAPAALLAQLATAIRFLTIVPVPGATVPVGQSAAFFPLVGLGVGAILVLVDRVLAPATPEGLRNVLLVAGLAIVTGGLHLDGLADSADGLLTRDRGRALAIMRDAATGVFGATALVLVLALKIRSLDVLPTEVRPTALLMAPMLARWAAVVLAFGSRPARHEGLGFAMVTSITFREFGLATVFALWVALASTAARGLSAVLVLAVVTIGCRILAHNKLGGVTGDLMGAIAELGEALVLAVFALGAPAGAALV